MKGLSTLRKTDAVGRIVIPIEIRKELNIGKDDSVEILLEDDHIEIKKYKEYDKCVVTGEVTPENRRYVNKMVLSPLGAKILFNEIKKSKKPLNRKFKGFLSRPIFYAVYFLTNFVQKTLS
ncbi:AbrB/MazE/SpoVT family DNA-binding domain-containing protein [Bacillus megaterium]|nr:AbrB/MazE/SpoVT family DNA-binding domain-containing protein [Priestia megaterium]